MSDNNSYFNDPADTLLHGGQIESDYEYIDESLQDIDFSEFKGDFKSSLKRIGGKLNVKSPKARRIKKQRRTPLHNIHATPGKYTLDDFNDPDNKIRKITVPDGRPVIIQSVDNFLLSNTEHDTAYKTIGYYKGKKLKELILTFNNNSAIDFNLELFNPSDPLDYFFSTSGNINNKITVAGGTLTYTDLLHYILANPTMIVNARMIVSGPDVAAQQYVAMNFINKNIRGSELVKPLPMPENIDTMQVQSTVLNFDIMGRINRPFIPDGMDIISYSILAGNTVTFCFYYKQKQLKRLMFKEARSKTLM